MAPHNPLRLPILVLTSLSALLAIATLSCAAHTLSTFNTTHSTNAWLLPLWPNHFETRDLATIIGTGAVILLCNGVTLASVLVGKIPPVLLPLSTLPPPPLALLSLILPGILHSRSPLTRTTTLQTWTCNWSALTRVLETPHGPGGEFGRMCGESRFAFFTQIPLLILQLALLGCALWVVRSGRCGERRGSVVDEKDRVELGEWRGQRGCVLGDGEGDGKSECGSPKVLSVRAKS